MLTSHALDKGGSRTLMERINHISQSKCFLQKRPVRAPHFRPKRRVLDHKINFPVKGGDISMDKVVRTLTFNAGKVFPSYRKRLFIRIYHVDSLYPQKQQA